MVKFSVFCVVLLANVIVQCTTEVRLPREITYPLCVYCCDETTLVLDGGKRSLKILSSDFKKVTKTIPLSIGQGPGELSSNFFSNPGAILLFKNSIVICDKRRRKINFYDSNGIFKNEIRFRKPIVTIEKKNKLIIVFFLNNGRIPPVTFAQQVDTQLKKVVGTTVVNRKLSSVMEIHGAKLWGRNFFCVGGDGNFIMLSDRGIITKIREDGEIIDELKLPVKSEDRISIQGNTVSSDSLARFNSMKTYKKSIYLTYVKTGSSTHETTTFLYRIAGKKITKKAFKNSVKELAGIINGTLILFDKDNESILRLPVSEIAGK